MTANVLRTCPECGKKKLERLIGAGAGILFKGGGFYETDYRSSSYKKAAESDSKAPKGDKPSSKKPAKEKGDKGPAKPSTEQ